MKFQKRGNIQVKVEVRFNKKKKCGWIAVAVYLNGKEAEVGAECL